MDNTLLLLFLFFIQIASAQKSAKAVKIADASSKAWISGAPGGRTGISYIIKIHVEADDKIDLANVWLGKENAPFDEELFSEPNLQHIFKKGDSLILAYNHIHGLENKNPNLKSPPFDYKGEALVELLVNDKPEYLTVKSFRKLEPLKGQ